MRPGERVAELTARGPHRLASTISEQPERVSIVLRFAKQDDHEDDEKNGIMIHPAANPSAGWMRPANARNARERPICSH